jgi:exonuclease SbcC
MRPVTLLIDGFASFRTRTEVDFTDADYFALVGPTGSGKSTVIDALLFALYGTAPRWERANAVTPALAPTASRAVVRLVFDARGQRYSVVREVRRTGSNTNASMRNQRLERFLDPTDTGEDLEPGSTELLAADSDTTPAVAALLGLDFGKFCMCVALPQGEFSKFLKVNAAERQNLLSDLLGYQLYGRIGQQAGQQAREADTVAATLLTQLSDRPPPTEQQIAELAETAGELTALSQALTSTLLPAVTAAADTRSAALAAAEELAARRTLLDAFTVPAGTGELAAALTAAGTARTSAGAALTEADAALTSAQATLDTATPEPVLTRVLADRAELAAVEASVPQLTKQVTITEAAHVMATSAVTSAQAGLLPLRALQLAADAAATAAQTRVTQAQQQATLLGTVNAPAGLPALAEGLRTATDLHSGATTRLAAAAAAEGDARTRLAEQPAATALTEALTCARQLADALTTDAALACGRAAAAGELSAATQEAVAASAQVNVALEALQHAELADRAAAIRTELVAGQPCPVCEQPVHTLPAAASAAAAIADARAELADAQARHAQAAAAHDEARRGADRATTLRDGALARAELDRTRLLLLAPRAGTPLAPKALRTALHPDIPADTALAAAADVASAVTTELAASVMSRDAIEQELTAAISELATAREQTEHTRAALDQMAASSAAATAELHRARGHVAALSPPELAGSDLLACWGQLTTWAHARLAEVSALIASASNDAAEAAADAAGKREVIATAEAELEQLRTRATTSALAKQQAQQQLTTASARVTELSATLASAPTAERATADLIRVRALAAARDDARTAREEAAENVRTTDVTLQGAQAAVDNCWAALRRARDPLTTLGAPEPADDDVHGAWTALASWVSRQGTDIRKREKSTGKTFTAAAKELLASVSAVTGALAAHELDMPPEAAVTATITEDPAAPLSSSAVPSLLSHAAAVTSSAQAGAQAAHAQALEAAQFSVALAADAAQARQKAEVAATLARLMRADHFQQWLVSAALESLLGDASEILMELSGNQFELTHDGRELYVLDHNDADSRRLARTLSGGETFQASLALALALSRQVTALAVDGASKLESIFLDEGFGTLDDATLDVVASTLETLASSGDRMVGVVTHVPALAERVPVRLRVWRDATGSHVARETA